MTLKVEQNPKKTLARDDMRRHGKAREDTRRHGKAREGTARHGHEGTGHEGTECFLLSKNQPLHHLKVISGPSLLHWSANAYLLTNLLQTGEVQTKA